MTERPVPLDGRPAPDFQPETHAPDPSREQLAAMDTMARLVDAYAEAKEAEQAAADRVKDLRDQLLAAYPVLAHADSVPLVGYTHVLKVTQTTSWRVDSTRLKREQAAVYAAYATETSSTRLTVSAR